MCRDHEANTAAGKEVERDALLSVGRPYYATGAGEDRIVVVINDEMGMG